MHACYGRRFFKVWPLSDENAAKLKALEDDVLFVPAHHHTHLRATARDALNAGNGKLL